MHGVDREHVLEIVLVGNPIMHHIALGIDPTPLGSAPFVLATDEAVVGLARDLDLDLPAAAFYAGPCIAGHVGADTAAALLAEIVIGVGAYGAGGIELARRAAPVAAGVPNIEAIGRLLYTRYLFVFEGAGLVLLVAMIGAIVLTYRQRGGVRAQNVSRQNARRPEDATRNTRPAVGEGVRL